jgi:hypothetical protein
VKLPSADAESDAPGEEKPFIRGALAGAVDIGAGRSAGGAGGDANMRVTSPGRDEDAAGGD